MNKIFDTDEELDKAYREDIKILEHLICPLLLKNCDLQCVCMRKPFKIERTRQLIKGYCINKMFFGSDER